MQRETPLHRRFRLHPLLAAGLVVFVSVALSVNIVQLGFALGAHAQRPCGPDRDLRREMAALRKSVEAKAPAVHRELADTTLVDICRDHLEKSLADDVARQARIVPTLRDGKAIGFKIYAVRPGSIFALLGVRNGDTVRSVNGIELAHPDAALEAYSHLQSASFLEVQLERRGAPRRIVVLIHDGCDAAGGSAKLGARQLGPGRPHGR